MPQPPFAHLRLHTEYSLEDGTVRIDRLVERARELGMPAIAVTDWHNLFGLVKFYRAAERAGIKPIAGADLRVHDPADPDHPGAVTVLCQDNTGYLNLCRLLSKSFIEGRHRGQPRVDAQWLISHAEGLILLAGWESNIGQAIRNGRAGVAAKQLDLWRHSFPGRCYIALQRLGRPDEASAETGLLQLALQTQTPVAATNDVRFLLQSEFLAHEARVCIHQGRRLDDKRRARTFVDQQYLKSGEEMAADFGDIPQALTNAGHIAERCNLTLELGHYVLPEFPVPEGETVPDFLKRKSREGLDKRISRHGTAEGKDTDTYRQRLEHELDVIEEMGYPGYFLIVADFIQWAKNNGVPVGPGRGSGGGSTVAWALGITEPDPLRYDLLFERFLNPERVSMPDFDIDFCMENRDRVIDYVAETYGRDQVCQIITFGTMAARAVVRDCGRVLGYNYGFVDSIAKLIPMRPDMTLEVALKEEPELRERVDSEEDTRAIIDLARSLEGLARNAGKHAGGVVIAPGPLTDHTPLYTEPNTGSVVTQYDKNDVESVGLVKFDFLGLRTLTIIDWALREVNLRRTDGGEKRLELDDIPLDDAATFRLVQSAHTTAVFQLESRGMKDLLRKLKPDSFDDIVAAVALFRPGPLDAGMVEQYIDRKHGKAPVKYPHPWLEPVLKPTYGIFLYQEQVMQAAQVLAGYSLGAADLLRRAMGKKDAAAMAEQREIFVRQAGDNGLQPRQAEEIFDLIQTFARYGFNKSHSVAYALLAYQTAWLKAHYPAEFMAAVLSADLDKSEKIANLVEDCKTMGLELLPPDVNASGYRFRVEDGNIRYGLGAIKGLGRGAVETIVTAREKHGRFASLDALCRKVDLSRFNRRALETLIRSGATDSLDPNRAALMHYLPDILAAAERHQSDVAAGQSDLFGIAADDLSTDLSVERAPVKAWEARQRLRGERDTLGLYLSGHPLDEMRDELTRFTTTPLGSVGDRLAGGRRTPMTLAGLVMTIRRRPGRGAFVTIDDGTGRLEVALFDRVFSECADRVVVDEVLIITGGVEVDDYSGGYRMVGEEVLDLDTARARFAKGVEVRINRADAGLHKDLEAAFAPYRPGATPVVVHYVNGRAEARLKLGDKWTVQPTAELISALKGLSGVKEVRLLY